jgi:hypothetical protein
MKKFSFLVLFAAMFGSVSAIQAQNTAKFHFELDYSYQLGLTQTLHGFPEYESSGSLGGHALTVNALYNVTPKVTAGVGFGLSRFYGKYSGDANTMPAYLTLRYRPLTARPAFYAYTDLGCALGGGDTDSNFTAGFLGTLGVGYQLMLKRHFGFNFKIGYNLHQFKDCTVYSAYETGKKLEDGSMETAVRTSYASLWRHSIQLGVGLVF